MIYIDSGAFLARYLAHDQCHSHAVRYWRELQRSREPCVTSNFVLDETITLLARRTTYAFAAERARVLYGPKSVTILRPDDGDEISAVVLFEKFADQRVSFTDCVSFALMRKHQIKRVFSFDRHFELAGFDLQPRIA